MGGDATGSGMDFQAEAFAYIASHGLADQTLDWFDDLKVLPRKIRMESGGPGDDLKVVDEHENVIEVQVKSGLQKRREFWNAITSLVRGLKDNSSLRAILFLDRKASKTLREELRQDIIRLSEKQTDNLRTITREVLDRLQELGIDKDSFDIFRRLRIVVVNLEPSSDGRAAAQALLSKVLEQPSSCDAVWTKLVDTGHDLISRRGQKETFVLARELSSSYSFAIDEKNRFAISVAEYLNQLEIANSSFFVPGLNVELRTESDWENLKLYRLDDDAYSLKQTLSEQIDAYHSGRRINSDESVTAEWVIEHNRQPAVVIGGPGSGKSTLSRRIAYTQSKRNVICARVSLSRMLGIVNNGNTFHEALAKEMALGTNASMENLRKIAAKVSLLIADGLDECGPARRHMANKLLSWLNAHPSCTAIVTTRPVGHSRNLLPDLRHYQLPSLEEHQVRSLSKKLHTVVVDDRDERKRLIERFNENIRLDFSSSSVSSNRARAIRELSSKTPLMLGFLVRLNCDGQPINKSSSTIYRHILDSAQNAEVVDRPAPDNVPLSIVNKVLNLLGWHLCHHRGISQQKLIELVEDDIVRIYKCSKFEAADRVKGVLDFWETRHIIEQLSADDDSAISFIHLSLAEFTAARYISSQTLDESDPFHGSARKPDFGRVIEFACGLSRGPDVIKHLIELDDPNDVCSTEAIIAARGLFELEKHDVKLSDAIANQLLPRLESPIPLVAIEASVALASVAKYVPELVIGYASSIQQHEQEWTRLAATGLLVCTGQNDVSLPAFYDWMSCHSDNWCHGLMGSSSDEIVSLFPAETYQLHAEVLHAGIRQLTLEAKENEVEEFMNTNSFKHYSVAILQDIDDVLTRNGYEKLTQQLRPLEDKDHSAVAHQLLRGSKRAKKGDMIFLEILSALGHPQPDKQIVPPLTNLSAVFEGLGLWRLNRYPTIDLAEGTDVVVNSLLAAFVSASRVDLNLLALEANYAKREILENSVRFWSLIDHVSVTPDWNHASIPRLSPQLLTAGLLHHWQPLRFVAANLIHRDSTGSDTTKILADAVNGTDDEEILSLCARVISSIYSTELEKILFQKLSNEHSRGSVKLFEVLALKVQDSDLDRFMPLIFRGLNADDQVIAHGFAVALCKHASALTEYLDRIKEVFNHWTERGQEGEIDTESEDVEDSMTFSIQLDNPRRPLIKILIELNAFTTDEIIAFTNDKHDRVARVAISEIIEKAKDDDELTQQIEKHILSAEGSRALVETFLRTRNEADHIKLVEELLESSISDLRGLAAGSLSRLPKKATKDLATKLLDDESAAIRSHAVRLLR